MEQRPGRSYQSINTVEDLLAAMRRGNSQALEIMAGDTPLPVRLLSAHEEATIAVKSYLAALKANPSSHKQELFEAQSTMKQILFAALTIDDVPMVAFHIIDKMPSPVLGNLYNQYVTLNNSLNPSFEDMKPEEIAAIIDNVKKKKAVASDFYTYQLAGIGKYFLQAVIPNLQTDNEPGS